MNKQRNLRLAAPRETDFQQDDQLTPTSTSKVTRIDQEVILVSPSPVSSGPNDMPYNPVPVDVSDDNLAIFTGEQQHLMPSTTPPPEVRMRNRSSHSRSISFSEQVIAVRHSDDSLCTDDASDTSDEKHEGLKARNRFSQSVINTLSGTVKKWASRSFFAKKDKDAASSSATDVITATTSSTDDQTKDQNNLQVKETVERAPSMRRRLSWSSSKQKSSEEIASDASGDSKSKPTSVSDKTKKRMSILDRMGLFSTDDESQPPTPANIEDQGQNKLNTRSTPGGEANAIMVLRIFSGNYDFKATYKTVAVTKETKVEDVLKATLIKFRVPGAVSLKQALKAGSVAPVPGNEELKQQSQQVQDKESEIVKAATDINDATSSIPNQVVVGIEKKYYLSVVHGDSKEKKLNPSDLILDVLLKLQSKSIRPGVAPSSQKDFIQHMEHVTANGKISSIRTPNDSEIKFLINAKLEDSSVDIPEQMLIRVYYFGDDFGTGTIQTVKTIGIKSDEKIREVVSKAIAKFKILKGLPPEEAQNLQELFHLWYAKEDLAVNGLGLAPSFSQLNSIVNSSSGAISEAPVTQRRLTTVIKPDTMISDELKMADAIRAMMKGVSTSLIEDMAFVLQKIPEKSASTSSPTREAMSSIPTAEQSSSAIETAQPTPLSAPTEEQPVKSSFSDLIKQANEELARLNIDQSSLNVSVSISLSQISTAVPSAVPDSPKSPISPVPEYDKPPSARSSQDDVTDILDSYSADALADQAKTPEKKSTEEVVAADQRRQSRSGSSSGGSKPEMNAKSVPELAQNDDELLKEPIAPLPRRASDDLGSLRRARLPAPMLSKSTPSTAHSSASDDVFVSEGEEYLMKLLGSASQRHRPSVASTVSSSAMSTTNTELIRESQTIVSVKDIHPDLIPVETYIAKQSQSVTTTPKINRRKRAGTVDNVGVLGSLGKLSQTSPTASSTRIHQSMSFQIPRKSTANESNEESNAQARLKNQSPIVRQRSPLGSKEAISASTKELEAFVPKVNIKTTSEMQP